MSRRPQDSEGDENFGLELRAPHEEITEQVKRAEQQLVDLQRKAEMLEAQKRELEDLAQRQAEVKQGRREMQEKLRRAIVVLEREEEAARREVQMLEQTRSAFSDALEAVESIDAENPEGADVSAALAEDLSRIDHARTIYNQHRSRLSVLRGEEATRGRPAEEVEPMEEEAYAEAVGRDGFGTMVARGFAHNLPLLLLGLIWLAIWLLRV
ncbi:MAG: hypothetical protein IT577_13025 [Verrucomicrobiae bacterium]|nr:hypothetical protein [Verrucomicrobiae bacterium]